MKREPITLGFVGDLMLGRGVNEASATLSPDSFWGDVLPLMRSAGAVFANLECPITESQREWRRCWKAFRFRADPRAVDILRAGNVRFVSLANNHMLDFESEGLLDTLRHLRAAGIAHAGAGCDSLEAVRPAIVEVAGLKIGVVSITDNMPEFAAGPGLPGTNYMSIRTDLVTLGLIATLIQELRDAGATLIVLSAHWGPNLRPWPPARFRRFARATLELGVDVFHGHSAHLVQGVELREGRIILYDTGDFLDDYWVFPFIRTDRSCLFLIDVVDGRVAGLRLVPVTIRPGVVRRAFGREGQAILARMLRLSRSFHTASAVAAAEIDFCTRPPELATAHVRPWLATEGGQPIAAAGAAVR
jgi:poly-gamma-glutamate synthesis protein (capsule biosynthesis protein)